jgi:hypothetical protein
MVPRNNAKINLKIRNISPHEGSLSLFVIINHKNFKTRYQSLKILPLELYKPFAEYLTTHYLRISKILGPAMNAEQKERVAGSMVRLMMDTGKLKVRAYVNLLIN